MIWFFNGHRRSAGSVDTAGGAEVATETVLIENTTDQADYTPGLGFWLPTAGIALGLDRLVAILTQADSIS